MPWWRNTWSTAGRTPVLKRRRAFVPSSKGTPIFSCPFWYYHCVMAMFVHLAPEKRSRSIIRSGIRLPRKRADRLRGINSMPVTKEFAVSHQWLRELKRDGERTIVAIHFRIPDGQLVQVGHFGRAKLTVTAAEAVGVIMRASDAEGYEVVIPRAIKSCEIHAIRAVRQVVGWRYFPRSHGKRPCGCPVCQPRGALRSRKIRQRYEQSL